MPRLTEKELVEAFAPSKEMIAEKIMDWSALRQSKVDKAKQALTASYESGDGNHWFHEVMIKNLFVPEIMACDRYVSKLKRILGIISPKSGASRGIRQEDIDRARCHSIYEFARSRLQLKKSGGRYFSLCPFHSEKRPSFCIYPETNTFHCFGCQAHGDVITLIMHLDGISFPEAVRMLQ